MKLGMEHLKSYGLFFQTQKLHVLQYFVFLFYVST